MVGLNCFEPAPELAQWLRSEYIEPDGAFYEEGLHGHLNEASIGCLWTCSENTRRGRRVVGEAEMPLTMGRLTRWVKDRMFQQLVGWFGEVPDFVLTFDAVHCDQVDDPTFCALVDHELTHCDVARDENGSPKFSKVTGLPQYCLRGHDVQEFVSVVRRFGIEAAGQSAVDMVIAASKKPRFDAARVAVACGNCLRLVA